MARLAREHNDANVLTIGERIVAWPEAKRIVETFLSTPASTDDRHRRRVEKIHSLTGR
jgi:ribose 5-phosphate isomerase B